MAIKDMLGGLNHNHVGYAEGGAVKRNEHTEAAEKATDESSTQKVKNQGGAAGGGAPMLNRNVEKPNAIKEQVQSKSEGGGVKDEEWEPKEQDDEGHVDKTGNGVNEIDADSVIDLFLEENPDLAEMPVEEWPEDAIKELQSVINAKGVDSPTGLNAEQEKEAGVIEKEPIEEEPVEEPTTDEPNDEQDFDIMELAKLVEAGDKDGAWEMLNSMFGARTEHSEVKDEPTNALDRMVSDSRVKRLSSIIGSLKF